MPSDLKERLEYVRKTFKFKSRNEMASTLGIENLRMQNLENGRSKHLFVEEAMLFQAVLKINPWWIMSGHGNMLLSDDKKMKSYTPRRKQKSNYSSLLMAELI